MRKLIQWIMLAISIFAASVDAFNVGNTFTRGQSWQQEGVVFGFRLILAGLVAALSWIAPISFSYARIERLKGQMLFWLGLIILSTAFNMACSKAYVESTWHTVSGVSGPITIGLPGIGAIYYSSDWFRDAVAFYPNFILLSMVAVSLDKEKKLSPEEEKQQLLDDIERAKIAKIRREQLDPLNADKLEQGAKSFIGKGRAIARGFGVDIPERQRKQALQEAVLASKGDAVLDAITSEGEIVALADDDLTPIQVGIILGTPTKPGEKKRNLSDRSIRDRLGKTPGMAGRIRGHKYTVKEGPSKGHDVWVIKASELAEDYPAEWAAYMKSKARQTRVQNHQRDRRRGEPIAIHS